MMITDKVSLRGKRITTCILLLKSHVEEKIIRELQKGFLSSLHGSDHLHILVICQTLTKTGFSVPFYDDDTLLFLLRTISRSSSLDTLFI
jgi:hypothetical protein